MSIISISVITAFMVNVGRLLIKTLGHINITPKSSLSGRKNAQRPLFSVTRKILGKMSKNLDDRGMGQDRLVDFRGVLSIVL